MSEPKGGLGRGLAALLPRTPVEGAAVELDAARAGARGDVGDARLASGDALDARTTSDSTAVAFVREVPIERVRPNPRQPREQFDDADLDALAASITEGGVLQPILVRDVGDGFELIAGERRLRASLRAGRSTIPAIVRDIGDDRLLIDALVENIQRVDLNPLEEAVALRALVDDLDATHDEVAKRIGRSRAAVTNSLRLLQLAPEVQRRVREGSLSAAHARTIAAIGEADAQIRAARRVIADGMSVRAAEALVKQMTTTLTAASVATRAAHAAAAATRNGAPAGILEAEMLLADRLETKVTVEHQPSGRGRIVIDYAGLEDLDRIVRTIREDGR